MPVFEIVCLANSLKYGRRCIAGIKTDSSGWLRPVSQSEDGALGEEHYLLEDRQEPQLFSILKINCSQPCPQPHQPENWYVSRQWWERWQFVGMATIEQLNRLLADEIKRATNNPNLLGNQSDRTHWDSLQANPLKRRCV